MTTENSPAQEDDLPEQLRIRREKRANLIDRGIEPYPVAVARTKSLKEVRDKYVGLEIDVATGDVESLTGRIIFKRDTGKLCFATLREGDGTELQAMLSLDRVGQEQLDAWKSDIDLGDMVSVTGEIITSKRGELSILADTWTLASKSLRPLPNEHNPLSEETRVRLRYVDLIVRPEAREIARTRPRVLHSLRKTFEKRDFLEVETPMLQVMHGGAAARPLRDPADLARRAVAPQGGALLQGPEAGPPRYLLRQGQEGNGRPTLPAGHRSREQSVGNPQRPTHQVQRQPAQNQAPPVESRTLHPARQP